MIKHIVMWKIKGNGVEKKDNCENIRRLLLDLKDKIPQIKEMSVSINSDKAPIDNYDLVLSVDFDNFDDLALYQSNPFHKEVASVIGVLRDERACIDYEF